MNRTVKIILKVGVVIVVSLVLLGLSCALAYLLLRSSGLMPAEQETVPAVPGDVSLPNPAAAYCEEQGHTLEIRTDSDGGQYGVCVCRDGSECDEWPLYREECGPESLSGAIAARDAALAYLAGHYGEQAPVPGQVWTLALMAESTAPEGSPGEVSCQFTAGDWTATISQPVGSSEDNVYTVAVANQSAGFGWEGTVNSAGEVSE